MKIVNIIFGAGASFIVIAAIMKILHLPGSATAGIVGDFAFLGLFIGLIWENKQLKKKIKELETA